MSVHQCKKVLIVVTVLLLSLPVTFILFEAEAARDTKIPSKIKAGSWDIRPFNLSIERLPPKYVGHSVKAIYEKTRALRLEKDEFETTDAFNGRSSQIRNALGLCAFAMKPSRKFNEYEDRGVWYDADTQTLNVGESDFRISEYRPIDEVTRVDKGSYVAQTIGGAKTTVAKGEYHKYTVALSETSYRTAPLKCQFKMSPEVAKKEKNNIMLLLIGQPNSIAEESSHYSATLSHNPFDRTHNEYKVLLRLHKVWIYNFNTGEILEKEAYNVED